MSRRLLAFAFVSGLVSLVYQVMWMRSLRLVFGASTAANAVVVAIFMAGLGLGGLYFGRHADRWDRPFGRYALIEGGIALSSMLTVALVHLVAWIYYALGGVTVLGHAGATAVRLLLSVLLLGPPTFLMGGTLPALARLIESETPGDTGRRAIGRLYGANTLGAVVGATTATFFSLELLGVSRSILVAGTVNLLLAVLAYGVHRRSAARDARVDRDPRDDEAPTNAGIAVTEDDPRAAAGLERGFILAAAMVVGFAFFAMEMVWYRVLAPLLGGSSYSFGLILVIALLGIGLGGGLYGLGERTRRPSLTGLGISCALEAAFIAAPLAFGDGLAVLAVQTRPLAAFGFTGLVANWTVIIGLSVLPAAIISGFQFPYLMALMGAGREDVARDLGVTYLFNTVGSVAGATASGLSLLVVVGAVPLWRALAWSLVLLAVVAVVLGIRRGELRPVPASTSTDVDDAADAPRTWRPAAVAAGAIVAAVVAASGPGPSAFWRHSPIGAGRIPPFSESFVSVEAMRHLVNRSLRWEADGIESTVAVTSRNGFSMIHNGKSDGNAHGDADTQVGLGLLGISLHPRPRRALVIGLGTGSTAGWVAASQSIEHVDVVELEPYAEHVAEMCAAVNRDVLDDETVELHFGDAREFLTVTGGSYDIIVSEPSNPYRAGVASLFSRDYYERAHARLADDGLFVQWLQGYEVDGPTLRVVIATIREVFPAVEIWTLGSNDYALVAYRGGAPTHDVARIERVLAGSPHREALAQTMLVAGTPGLFANFVAGPALADRINAVDRDLIDTDDVPVLEFGFARMVGQQTTVPVDQLQAAAARLDAARPEVKGVLDWNHVIEARQLRRREQRKSFDLGEGPSADDPAARARFLARQTEDPAKFVEIWESQPAPPMHRGDQVRLAEAYAGLGRATEARDLAAVIAVDSPTDAHLIEAIIAGRAGDPAAVLEAVEAALLSARVDPWFTERLFQAVVQMAHTDSTDAAAQAVGRRMFELLAEPLAVGRLDDWRRGERLQLARTLEFDAMCVEALADLEPWFEYERSVLQDRVRCYVAAAHPLAEQAAQDLERYYQLAGPATFGENLPDRP